MQEVDPTDEIFTFQNYQLVSFHHFKKIDWCIRICAAVTTVNSLKPS